ncbi:MAG: ABC transporter substrate-binding protein [Clostridia bacterium]|nr:ABC transporter substrate-binding protein [Clostridia bacterium]
MKKTLSLILALLMMLSIVPMASAEEALPEVVVYMMGDKPADCDMVMEKVNEILKKELGCTMSMNFVGWADWGTAYQLLLTGGNKIDLIYNASWASDKDYARKGAFKDLTDIVEEAAPELWDMIPMEAWEFATLPTDNGDVIYCIPTAYVNYTSTGIIYRQDLCEKYNLPAPDSIENAYLYQKGIKENCPEMFANMDGGTRSWEIMMLDNMFLHYEESTGIMIGSVKEEGETPSWAKIEKYISPDNEWFLQELKTAKEWADAGFWDRNLSSNPVDGASDYLVQGMLAMYYNGNNIDKFSGTNGSVLKDHPDWKVGFVPYGLKQGYVFYSSPTQDATAIPITAENPEMALKVMELIYTNEELHHLFAYGIKDVHYTVDENGSYVATEAASNFGQYAMNTWAWKRTDFFLEGAVTEEGKVVEEVRAKLAAATPLMPTGFSFDRAPVEAKVAAVEQVISQYLTPLRYGLTDNLEADLANFFEKANAAGLQEVQDEYIRQYTEYCMQNGVK